MPEITAESDRPARPDDRFLETRSSFPRIDRRRVARAFERVHELSETVYAGHGLWEGRLVRLTSRRLLGYLAAAERTGQHAYVEHAREAADRLLVEQGGDGVFPWYHHSIRGLDRGDHALYETGIAGTALARAARFFGDGRYLAASRRSAQWAVGFPVSPNTNYNLFAVWHLCEHHALEPDESWVEAAAYRAAEGCLDDQLPCGAWPGHNSWIWYHGIIVRGLAALDGALPSGHRLRPRLEKVLIRAVNRILVEQTDEGLVPPNPDETNDRHRNAFCLQALLHLAEPRRCAQITRCVDGLAGYRLQALENAEAAPVDPHVPQPPAPAGPAVWQDRFDGYGADCAYGPCPQDWAPAWIPGHEPSPETTRWTRDPVWGHGTSEGLCVSVRGGHVNSGPGLRLPPGTLVEGQPYRLQGWMRVHESLGAAGCVVFLQASAWSGLERPVWDAWTDCKVGLESPRRGQWRPVGVDFVAGPTNHVYFLAHSSRVPHNEIVKVWVSDAAILPLNGPPAPDPRPSPIESLECEVMAFGEYLLRRYDPGASWPA